MRGYISPPTFVHAVMRAREFLHHSTTMEILDAVPEGTCGSWKVPDTDRSEQDREHTRRARAYLGRDPAGPWSVLSNCYLDESRGEYVHVRSDGNETSLDEDIRVSTEDIVPNVGAIDTSTSTSPFMAQDKDSATSSHPVPPADDTKDKRQRNIEAARRYRKRKVDLVASLEGELAATKKELESTKLRLARAEAEADVLRRMLQQGR